MGRKLGQWQIANSMTNAELHLLMLLARCNSAALRPATR
jgi:hypothetical protein